MSNYLDPVPKPYKPPRGGRRYRDIKEEENLEGLNNEGREEVTEDFRDRLKNSNNK